MLAAVADVRHDGRGRGCHASSGGHSECDQPKAEHRVEEQPQSEEQAQHAGDAVQEVLGQPLVQQRTTAIATPSASTMPAVAPIQTPAQLWSLASATVASIVLSPSSARTNEEMTASSTCRGSAILTASAFLAPRPSRQVHTAHSR
jgi:hypothetical protein